MSGATAFFRAMSKEDNDLYRWFFENLPGISLITPVQYIDNEEQADLILFACSSLEEASSITSEKPFVVLFDAPSINHSLYKIEKGKSVFLDRWAVKSNIDQWEEDVVEGLRELVYPWDDED